MTRGEALRHLLDRFGELVDLEPAEREQRLLDRAREEPEVVAELRAMFQSDTPERALELERHLHGAAPEPAAQPAELVGTEVGPYHLVRLLGRGGMGEVYLATRSHGDFQQPVALKVLRRELAGPQAVERFHRECRIQARLSHPAIVPLIDVGLAADGRPWLALLYVEGEPITRYAEAHRLTIAQRLQLVVACCRAVEAAHRRLVVHRDLKPSNILVEADGSVRLLDFGIAKVLDDEPEQDLTRQAVAPMTPERAAPEQLRGEPSTTATDVWGLGVLLYELVTGQLPFDVKGRTPREIEREIRERGPTRPSRAVLKGGRDTDPSAHAAGEQVAQARSTTLRRLTRDLCGDLEVVLMRSLAAEPERRYPSAAAFADDLERLLARRPVAARPDSWRYRTRRFVGRHRVAVAGAALASVGLVTLGAATVVQSVRTERERDRATALERQSAAVVDLLIELFGDTSPLRGAGVGDVSIDQLLAQGANKVETLAESPGVRQRMYATLGRIRMERSEFARGRELFERARAVGGDAGLDALATERITLELDYTQALARMDEGEAARRLLEPLVARLESQPEPPQEALAEALAQLALVVPAAEGPALAARSLELRRGLDPPRPVEVASSLDAVANLAFRAGERALARERWAEAVPILERELGNGDVRTLSTLNNLAVVTEDIGEQITLLRRVVAGQERLLGPESAPVANTWNNIGVALGLQGNYAAAEQALRTSHRLRLQVLGADHRETVRTLRNVARVVELQGRYGEALGLFDEVLERLPATGLPQTIWPSFAVQRAAVLWRLGRLGEARAAQATGLEALRQGWPAGHEEIVLALLLGARLEAARGNYPAAVALAQEARDAREAREAGFAEGHPKLAEARAELGRCLTLAGEPTRGRELLAQNLPALAHWGLLHPEDRAALETLNGAEEIPPPRGRHSSP